MMTVGWLAMSTDRFNNTWKAPLSAQEPVAVEAAIFVQIPVQYIHSYYARVHWIGILSHRCFDHRLPGVAVEEERRR